MGVGLFQRSPDRLRYIGLFCGRTPWPYSLALSPARAPRSWVGGDAAIEAVRCAELLFFFFSSRRRHTRCSRDWSSDVCSSDLFPFFLSPCGRGEGEGYLYMK